MVAFERELLLWFSDPKGKAAKTEKKLLFQVVCVRIATLIT